MSTFWPKPLGHFAVISTIPGIEENRGMSITDPKNTPSVSPDNFLHKVLYDDWDLCHLRRILHKLHSAGGGRRGGGAQEAKNMPNIHLQEKFHRGILWGLRNISDTP